MRLGITPCRRRIDDLILEQNTCPRDQSLMNERRVAQTPLTFLFLRWNLSTKNKRKERISKSSEVKTIAQVTILILFPVPGKKEPSPPPLVLSSEHRFHLSSMKKLDLGLSSLTHRLSKKRLTQLCPSPHQFLWDWIGIEMKKFYRRNRADSRIKETELQESIISGVGRQKKERTKKQKSLGLVLIQVTKKGRKIFSGYLNKLD